MENTNLDCYVFTTKYVVKHSSFITTVLHESNGDWQFLGCEQNLDVNDAMIVSLGEMLNIDSSLQSIIDLPYGKKAIRDNINSKWAILDISE